MDASVVGIGQLITQRKRLGVPAHQREYSWTRDVVQEFSRDLLAAATLNEAYFIGMIVLLGPVDSSWSILDGQQRLVTASLIYSSIARWLEDAGKPDDAKQLRDDYLQVRQLGGATGPRLQLSDEITGVYRGLVLGQGARPARVATISDVEAGSAEAKIREASEVIDFAVREWIEAKSEERVDRAYALSAFIEKAVTVVALDVRDEASAYVIFETLNDRGMALTVWDLVRNHLLKECRPVDAELVSGLWKGIVLGVRERDADDFLKVFWTSMHGRVQRGSLFDKIRSLYSGGDAALKLASELSASAQLYAAVTRTDDDFWTAFPSTVQDSVAILDALNNRQLRPVVIAALRRFDRGEILKLLELFIDLLVRYQVVGKRRTGAIEIGAARLAKKITTGEVASVAECRTELNGLWVSDDEFMIDVAKYYDSNHRRVLYLASAVTERNRLIPAHALRSGAALVSEGFESNASGSGGLSIRSERVRTSDLLETDRDLLLRVSDVDLVELVRRNCSLAQQIWRG